MVLRCFIVCTLIKNQDQRRSGMKLIYAIVNNDDSHDVSSTLTKAGFFATKLASTERSRRRKQYMPAGNIVGSEMHGATFPVEVSVGGATIFVTDVERFEKV